MGSIPAPGIWPNGYGDFAILSTVAVERATLSTYRPTGLEYLPTESLDLYTD